MSNEQLDPRTPVLVGVGQASDRLGGDDYRALSPADLAAEAAHVALADTGVDLAAVAAAIDTVAGIRQFETSSPGAVAPLGRSNNFPRSVAKRVGADPVRAILEVGGGQGPQHLVNELSAHIAAGNSEVALLFGAETISTAQHFADRDDRPDFTEHVDGTLEDRGFGLRGLMSFHHSSHGLVGASEQYALFENARRSRLKTDRSEQASEIGALFAPFTEVAAANPHASAPIERSAEELVDITEQNRMIAEPYPRYVVSRDKVNQAAAVLVMSVAAAERLGVPRERWVFLHGHADLRERNMLDRVDLSGSPAAVLAAEHALDIAGIGVDEIATFDLYSCFPIAVSNVADGLGLAPDDPRRLTVTGGLPFFGGAGNNYSMHAIAETVVRMRAQPGVYGFVGANGGMLSKYSVGVYSTTPTNWRSDRSALLQETIDALPAPATTRAADGWATIETWTVRHDRDGQLAIVIGRLEADGRRFLARSVDGDDTLVTLLTQDDDPVGCRVYVRNVAAGNRVTIDRDRMDEILPVAKPCLRDNYEHVLVRRDGHVLEVTINRPEQRNSLHPPANVELAEIFDAYFSDPDLWVAILTGAGDKAFCAGNDLLWSASGRPITVPTTGFAGLTARRGMSKPVISAVNGYAMGGGCEIALASHLVVADSAAAFALSEVKVGLVAGAGGVVRLPRAIPVKLATEMIVTGRRMGADEALRHGLVNRITAPGEALAGARELASEIVAASPTSVRASLQIMHETDGIPDVVDAVLHPSEALDDVMLSEDAIEGPTAFAQKRAPNWRGR
ncbi:acetyl-CoA acetyltransferase [Rhodococcus sp. T2V]|uniref:acetyl-CoA acetyltransferase n=1 Tax=Rhodococcus sp. T2V TaxID=3034164 RepID=UPI0023E136B2|nr:acetyl-CoA acetyltransferase [Rhodococcus sp. T2V]MDF3312135.1 acetyl-CoA acetyltransferase [Rhodococcus sp. T2V]